MSKLTIVAIDGPSASGKSTVARNVARAAGWVYVDSGSFYRGLTWKVLREGVDRAAPAAVGELIQRIAWELGERDGQVRFLIDGEDPGQQVRSEPVREAVSDVAAIPAVREFITARLRQTTDYGSLAMEGRDIGSVVFPATPFKYYLDADPAERARRRLGELASAEPAENLQKVRDSLLRRDAKDSSRKTAPLQIPLGAKVIDSTALSAEQVTELVLADLRRAGVLA